MAHPHARLTPVTRAELVRQVAAGWSQAEVARQFRVSRPTVGKWVRRYRAEGVGGLRDRPSVPRRSPRRTSARVARRICALRRRTGWGPHRLAWALGLARSTIYAILRRAGLQRLDRLHRVTRRVVRYEHPRAGDLLHLDVKKLGRIPPGGGKRFAPGFAATGAGPSRGGAGVDALHVAIDDHSRYVYVESLPDERGPTAAGFLQRALVHFRQQASGCAGCSRTTAAATARTPSPPSPSGTASATASPVPIGPRTNGKAERFIRILQDEWAYARPYRSQAARQRQLPPLPRRLQSPASARHRGRRPRLTPVNNVPGEVHLAARIAAQQRLFRHPLTTPSAEAMAGEERHPPPPTVFWRGPKLMRAVPAVVLPARTACKPPCVAANERVAFPRTGVAHVPDTGRIQ